MTRMIPLRLIILHFSHIGLTEDLTFMIFSFQKNAPEYYNTGFMLWQALSFTREYISGSDLMSFVSPDDPSLGKIIRRKL